MMLRPSAPASRLLFSLNPARRSLLGFQWKLTCTAVPPNPSRISASGQDSGRAAGPVLWRRRGLVRACHVPDRSDRAGQPVGSWPHKHREGSSSLGKRVGRRPDRGRGMVVCAGGRQPNLRRLVRCFIGLHPCPNGQWLRRPFRAGGAFDPAGLVMAKRRSADATVAGLVWQSGGRPYGLILLWAM